MGGRKVQLFPGPSVYLQLDGMDELVAEFPEVSPFGDILPYQLVHILYPAFLPRGITVGKVYRCLEGFRYFLMRAELEAIVSGYRQHILPVRV